MLLYIIWDAVIVKIIIIFTDIYVGIVVGGGGSVFVFFMSVILK